MKIGNQFLISLVVFKTPSSTYLSFWCVFDVLFCHHSAGALLHSYSEYSWLDQGSCRNSNDRMDGKEKAGKEEKYKIKEWEKKGKERIVQGA